MNRNKKLKKLYQKIGGIEAKRISEYQKLFDLKPGKMLSNRTPVEIFDELNDKKLDFNDLSKIIDFEKENEKEFYEVVTKIQSNIDNAGNIRTLNSLYKNLLDILEAVKSSYLTINSFEKYTETYYKMKFHVDKRNEIFEGQKILKSFKKG